MTNIDMTNTIEYKRPSYKWYIEYNEGLGYKHCNINLDRKSDIVRILKPKNDTESKSLTDKLLIDVKFPLGYIFSIAGKGQIQNMVDDKSSTDDKSSNNDKSPNDDKSSKEFDKLFTLSIKICDSNNDELNPESRIIIHKEKDIDEYETDVVRLESTFYKNVSYTTAKAVSTELCKEHAIYRNSVKTIDELYKFRQGVEFKGDEHLRIYVVDSDIDINPENVEFNINLDRWEHS